MEEIREGSVTMFYDQDEKVFYNKIMVFNRDISIQVISLFSQIVAEERRSKFEKSSARYEHLKAEGTATNIKPPRAPPAGITILDALAATGLRSVRYLKEIPGCMHVTINDLDPEAVAAANKICTENNVDPARYSTHQGDASLFMYLNKDPEKQFDVIDLDPYGTASPFLDSAVQAVRDGGLLCITCTDMPTLSGNYPEVCFAKYGCMPIKGRYTHEMSLRILLHAIDSAANRYKRHIVPWMSLSVDYYVRVFVRVFESPAEVKRSSLRRGYVYQSNQCPSFYIQTVGKVTNNNSTYLAHHVTAPSSCEETGGAMKIGGPFWTAPIHDQLIVDKLLQRVIAIDVHPESYAFPVSTIKRIVGVVTCISEELKDVVLYYLLPDLFATVRSSTPTNEAFISALLHAGYRVSQFHHEPTAIKTDAPTRVIWDIVRKYCQLNPPVGSSHKQTSEAAQKILSRDVETNVIFDRHENYKRHREDDIVSAAADAEWPKEKRKVTRFPGNPEQNWGPKRRAGRKQAEAIDEAAVSEAVVSENDNQMESRA